MALFTKCILSDPMPCDGLRVSVMSRHTLADGKTPDPRIVNYDIHAPILGPSPVLIGDYYKRRLPWDEFERRYLEEMRASRTKGLVRMLARTAVKSDITLLCIENSPAKCHRRLLAEECGRYVSALIIAHR